MKLVGFKLIQTGHGKGSFLRISNQHIVLVNIIRHGIFQGRPSKFKRSQLYIFRLQIRGHVVSKAILTRDTRTQQDFIDIHHRIDRTRRAEVGLQPEHLHLPVRHTCCGEVEHQMFPHTGCFRCMVCHRHKLLFKPVTLKHHTQLRVFALAVILHVQVFVTRRAERHFQHTPKACPIIIGNQAGIFPTFGGSIHIVACGIVHHFKLTTPFGIHVDRVRKGHLTRLEVVHNIVLRPQRTASKQCSGQDKYIFQFHILLIIYTL